MRGRGGDGAGRLFPAVVVAARTARCPGRRAARALLGAALAAGGLGATTAPAASAAPPVTAPQALVVEATSGEVVFARQAEVARPVASATKLMTALVVLERLSLNDVFTAGAYRPISPAETRVGLRPGERMTVRDLLRALLLASANDAAQALAHGTAGSTGAFVELMNQRARELGLDETHYSNPIGLDQPGNYSSADDLVRLTARLRRNPFFARTVSQPRVPLSSGLRPRMIENRNELVGSQPWVDGVKTGHTLGAGYVLVGSASRRGVSVISAVLGDPSEAARDADTLALLHYGLDQFRAVPVLRRQRAVATAAVRHREEQRVRLVPARHVTRVVRRGRRPSVRALAPRTLEGPLPAGTRAGTAVVRVGSAVVDRVPLVTATAVPGVGRVERALGVLLRPGTLAVIALAGAVALLAVSRRRRPTGTSSRTPSA